MVSTGWRLIAAIALSLLLAIPLLTLVSSMVMAADLMRRPRGGGLAAFACALGLAAWANTAAAQESVSFRSLDNETTLTAYLDRPATEEARPAIVMMHGCSGLLDRNGRILPIYHAWARMLVAKGYVVLVVDSAKSRGFGQSCTAGLPRRTMLRDRPKDAYAALQYLQAQRFVRADRIALMGWSQGGATVLLTINEKSIGRPQPLAQDFNSAIAFYPGSCSETFQTRPYTQVEPGRWTTQTPLLVLFGEADVWTPFAPCEAFVNAAKARGNPLELKSYPRAVHAFDAPNADRRELPAYRNGDGPIPLIGTDDEARADALLRVLAFLERHFAQ
ncbi:Dienelactone hydrolase [Bosea sp. OK403]|uniref:dienelactone hydrolase family protein n=1 Tax=Bosea sp. OK403 TaxID=1855286 RepID=UPI0008F44CB4|nr:prolyl oligopeptidase family serine peptidase [Bosea sp. OK403]SFI32068.1 Dienelactone hydrolase [Bosea sp. OK403]